MTKETDTSKKVMDRIMNENRWAVPVHKHETKGSQKFRILSSVVSILLLVGISVSLIFIPPSSSQKQDNITSIQNISTTVKTTDFPKKISDKDIKNKNSGSVTSIGEPRIYHPGDNKKQLYWIFSILGISMITLFMSWLTGENNDNKNRT